MRPSLVCLLFLGLAAAQVLKPPTDSSTTTPTPPSTSTPTSTSSSTSTSASTTASNSLTTAQSSSSSTTTSTSQSQSSSSSTNAATTPSTTALSASTTPTTLVTTATNTLPSSPPSSPSPTSSGSDGSSALGIGPIIGMSVAGGIAVIGVIAFIIWKLTRKRFAEFDDNEAIKWPELNSHGNPDPHPMPVNTSGRAGFETGSEASLSRVNSDNYSTPDFINASGPDPYAVPPLPHLNPNQLYHDDPAMSAAYYDPYRGPVPGTIEHEGVDWSGEAIPMAQMGPAARTISPAPSAPFTIDSGRQSPSLRRPSPGPQMAYGGARYDPYGAR